MIWSDYAILAAALVVGYLLGSIPFGLLITRNAGLGKGGEDAVRRPRLLRTGL